MSRRDPVARVFALALAVALGWSLSAACIEGAGSASSAQMACCTNGHHTCGHDGAPAECCTSAPQASQFTAVGKIAAPLPQLVLAQVFGSFPTTLQAPWHPSPLTDTWSPPGTKPPTYLLLTTLRI